MWSIFISLYLTKTFGTKNWFLLFEIDFFSLKKKKEKRKDFK